MVSHKETLVSDWPSPLTASTIWEPLHLPDTRLCFYGSFKKKKKNSRLILNLATAGEALLSKCGKVGYRHHKPHNNE